MTSHLNINWGATAEQHRREFNTTMRWTQQNDPQSRLVTHVMRRLQENDGCGRAIERDATVSPAAALRHQLHRRTVSAAEHRPSHGGTLTSGGGAPTRAKAATPGPPQVPHSNHNQDASSTTTEQTQRQDDAKRVLHCRRKHRKNCPKHLLNEMRRRDEALAAGLPEPPSAALEPDAVLRERREGGGAAGRYHPTAGRLPNALPIVAKPRGTRIVEQPAVTALVEATPYLVGKSIAQCLTGAYDPSVNVKQHRMAREHPDFGAEERKAAEDYERCKHQPLRSTRRSRGGGAGVEESQRIPVAATSADAVVVDRHLSHVRLPKETLLRDDIDLTHYRRKYDLKTHLETMRRMGKDLLRDFAGGKGFR